MKRIAAVISLFALVAFTATVHAAVTVDFSVLGPDSINITTASNPQGYTLNEVTFRYDDFGSGVDSAQVDAAGIFGSTFGSLIFDFDAPAVGLNFDFALLGVLESIPDALFITFKSGRSDVDDMNVSAAFTPYDPGDPSQGGDALGTLAYSGASFDQAIMFFSVDAPFFSVENLSYEPVPEPSSLAVMAAGLLGLCGCRRLKNRC